VLTYWDRKKAENTCSQKEGKQGLEFKVHHLPLLKYMPKAVRLKEDVWIAQRQRMEHRRILLWPMFSLSFSMLWQ
jgi:serine protease inhibitor ecotin